MKLKEKYTELKNENITSIVLIKSGSFYLTFDNDATILNYIFSYQINGSKVGFPLKNIDKVVSILNEKSINCIVLEDNEIKKFEHEINNYSLLFNEAKKFEFNFSMNNMLIDRIKFLLEKDPDNYLKIKRFIDEF